MFAKLSCVRVFGKTRVVCGLNQSAMHDVSLGGVCAYAAPAIRRNTIRVFIRGLISQHRQNVVRKKLARSNRNNHPNIRNNSCFVKNSLKLVRFNENGRLVSLAHKPCCFTPLVLPLATNRNFHGTLWLMEPPKLGEGGEVFRYSIEWPARIRCERQGTQSGNPGNIPGNRQQAKR